MQKMTSIPQHNCQKTGRKGSIFTFYHSDPMLKSVDNLKASFEYIAGAPVEVSIEKPMNVTVITSFYLRELL